MSRTINLTARYGADPVPWVTDIWAEALGRKRPDTRAAGALEALDTVIGGLADDERPYAVRFAGDPVGAATSLKDRVVHVGAAPLTDATLTRGQVAAIMSGLAFHEACHIRYTRKVMTALDRFPGDRARAARVSNVAEDIRGERLGCADFPGLAATLPVTLAWVAGRTMPARLRAVHIADRFNVLLTATRYAEWADWTGAEAERALWDAWAERAAGAHTVDAHAAVIAEALALLDAATTLDPEPPSIGEPEPGTGGKGEDEPEGEGKGKGKGKGEPTDDQGEGEPTDGEPGEGEPEGDPTDDQGKPGTGTPTDGPSNPSDGEAPDDDGLTLPECPAEAVKDGNADQHAQGIAESVARARREVGGSRSYDNGYGGTSQVVRAYQTRRGSGIRAGGGDDSVAFMAPTTGKAMLAAGGPTIKPTVRPMVARALAGAIASARKGDPVPEPGQRSGTLDRARLARVASGDCRVFTNRAAPGPQRIRAIVLLDASGSMQTAVDGDAARAVALRGGDWRSECTTRASAAAQIGVDMAGAFAAMPNVTGAVYAHNVNLGGQSTVHALWQDGEPVHYAGDYANLHLDGNRDDQAIRYCTDDLLDARKPGESLVLIVVSDGEPPDRDAVRQAVRDARDRGVAVVSVAISTEAEDGQRHMYGDDVVRFTPEPLILARQIARAIGKRV